MSPGQVKTTIALAEGAAYVAIASLTIGALLGVLVGYRLGRIKA